MGCFGRLGRLQRNKVAPSGDAQAQAAQERQQQREQALTRLDAALRPILQAAKLSSKLPTQLSSLTEQLQAALAELQTSQGVAASALLAAITQASNQLLRILQRQRMQQQHHQLLLPPMTQPAAGVACAAAAAAASAASAADDLVSAVGAIAFARVVLDTQGVLQRRHQQLQQLIEQLGFSSCSSLAAAVQPANKAVIASIVLGGTRAPACGELKLVCTVRRQHAFWDALGQLQQQGITLEQLQERQAGGGVALAKLFPRFVDEALLTQQQHPQAAAVEAGEGHGPRKEFFQAAALNWTTAALPGQPALLVHLRAAGSWWFNSTLQCSSELQHAYYVMGWLVAQSLTNHCTLGLPLAPLLLHLLLPPPADTTFQPSLGLLQQHDPDAARSISAVLQLPDQLFRELLHVEQLPGSTSREAYVQRAVQQLLVQDVAWQLEAARQGFAAGTDVQVLTQSCLTGSDLAAAVCGCTPGAVPADFRVQQAFRVVLEDDDDAEGGGSSSTTAATLQCLWHVLDGWDTPRKQAFVKFVTGTDRLPAHPGSEQLVISFPFVACGAKDQQVLLGTLPQSHTCSNTLELPDYTEALLVTQPDLWREWAATCGGSDSLSGGGSAIAACPSLRQACCRVLEDKLLMAITCTSFGLDDS